VGRLALEDLLEAVGGLLDPVDRLADVDRQADGARLVGDGAGDRLADPPGGVGAELVAAGVVELVGRLHQADVALLDQVQEGEAAADILLGDADDEPEVGLNQMTASLLAVISVLLKLLALHLVGPLLALEPGGGVAAALHALGEPDLLLHRQQVGLADLLQVETDGIADAAEEVIGTMVGLGVRFVFDLDEWAIARGLFNNFNIIGDQCCVKFV